MKLSPVQETHLASIKRADAAYRAAKNNARARIIQLVDDEISDYSARRDLEIRLAYAAGVPKKKIGEIGLGTTAGVTVNESLARTDASAAEQQEAGGVSYSITGKTLYVTLSGPTLAEALTEQDWPEDGPDSAPFKVNAHGVLEPGIEDYMPEVGRRHPVVAWALAHEAEVIEWWKGHAKA